MTPRWQRAYVVSTCAVIAGAFAYTACDWGRWPKLTFHPLTGSIAMREASGSITINYLGVIAWGVGGAAVGAVCGALACRVWPRAWPARALQLLGAWAITAVLLAGSYYTWSLFPW